MHAEKISIDSRIAAKDALRPHDEIADWLVAVTDRKGGQNGEFRRTLASLLDA